MSKARLALMSAMMQGGSTPEPEPYEGWEYDKALLSTGVVTDIEGFCTSPFIEVDPNVSTSLATYFYFGEAEATAVPLVYYNANKVKQNYVSANAASWANSRVLTIRNDTAYIRLTCKTANLDNCHTEYRNTTNYLFKGRNV